MFRARLARLAGVVVAFGCALALVPALAYACSCVQRDAATSLKTGVPALIAEVVAKQPIPLYGDPLQNPSLSQEYVYTLKVERAFNADFGPQLTIRASDNSAACGFAWNVGQRVGAFVWYADGQWRTSLCGLIAPGDLEAAAQPPVPPPVVPEPPPTEPRPVLRVRVGGQVADAGARDARRLDRLVVKPGARLRLGLTRAAKAVKVAPARANGRRLGRPRSVRPRGADGLTWVAKLPRSLPRRTDRLLVWIDYGHARATLAIGLRIDRDRARASLAADCPPDAQHARRPQQSRT
jgi:hypothetical protein